MVDVSVLFVDGIVLHYPYETGENKTVMVAEISPKILYEHSISRIDVKRGLRNLVFEKSTTKIRAQVFV